DHKGLRTVVTRPYSSFLNRLLAVMKDAGYIGEFEKVEDGQGSQIKISLVGKVNDCGSIRPRHPVKAPSIEAYEERFLPAKGVGLIIISTPNGIVSHIEAKEKKIGGRLLAYVY
ncbi:30S ribosomal protein S8, partial [Candidatus Micrarchaeota archaeon]|nr:30S ribosomal protein S8 [Candidatus Micrarchaeota archaeon]